MSPRSISTAFACLLPACFAQESAPASEPVPPLDAECEDEAAFATDDPAIVTLRTRDHVMRIRARGDVRVSVHQLDGKLLAGGLALPELERRFPELHDAYRRMFADDTVVLDASLAPATRDLKSNDRR